jgi:hypothetical protein
MTRLQTAMQKRQNAERAIVNYLAACRKENLNPRATATYRALDAKLFVAKEREDELGRRRSNHPQQPHQVPA